jgi:hypothetical protein
MAFDQQQPGNTPVVDPHRRTTKVNITIAVGVLIFLAVGIFVMWFASKHDDNRAMDDIPTRHSAP